MYHVDTLLCLSSDHLCLLWQSHPSRKPFPVSKNIIIASLISSQLSTDTLISENINIKATVFNRPCNIRFSEPRRRELTFQGHRPSRNLHLRLLQMLFHPHLSFILTKLLSSQNIVIFDVFSFLTRGFSPLSPLQHCFPVSVKVVHMCWPAPFWWESWWPICTYLIPNVSTKQINPRVYLTILPVPVQPKTNWSCYYQQHVCPLSSNIQNFNTSYIDWNFHLIICSPVTLSKTLTHRWKF